MSGRGVRAAFTALLFAAAALVLTQTVGLGPAARLVPQAVVVPTLVLLGVQLSKDLRIRKTRRDPERPASAGPRDESSPGAPSRHDASAMGWVLALPASMLTLGILPSIVLYVAGYLRFRTKARWVTSVLVALALCALVHFLFGRVLGVPLSRGLFAERRGT